MQETRGAGRAGAGGGRDGVVAGRAGLVRERMGLGEGLGVRPGGGVGREALGGAGTGAGCRGLVEGAWGGHDRGVVIGVGGGVLVVGGWGGHVRVVGRVTREDVGGVEGRS